MSPVIPLKGYLELYSFMELSDASASVALEVFGDKDGNEIERIFKEKHSATSNPLSKKLLGFALNYAMFSYLIENGACGRSQKFC